MFESFKSTLAFKIEESREQLRGAWPELHSCIRGIQQWFSPRIRRALRAAEASDWGRIYGWSVEMDGKTVAEFDYVQWDVDSQFWHEYRLKHLTDDLLPPDPDWWAEQNLTLRNRRFPDVTITMFLVSFRTFLDDGLVRIRSARVPEERFLQEETSGKSPQANVKT